MPTRAAAPGGHGAAAARRRSVVAALMLALAVLPGVLGCARPRPPGERLYLELCAKCHGLDGAGQTPRAIGYPKADLLDSSSSGTDPASLELVIRSGVDDRMPAFDQLSDEELQQLLAHLRYLRGETTVPG